MTKATHERWMYHKTRNPWAKFIKRTQHTAYQGIRGARNRLVPVTPDQALNDYNLQLKQCAHRYGMPFASTPYIQKWTTDLQSECIKRGFFLHRSWPHNAVNILSPLMIRGIVDHDDPISNVDGDQSFNWLHHLAFAEGPSSIVFFSQLFAFIKQQDYYGFSDGWEYPCDIANKYLRWHKKKIGRVFTGIVILNGVRTHINTLKQIPLNKI